MPRFFFSYARLDTRDEYLERFFVDLCDAVAGRTGQPVGDVAFRDTRAIQVGQWWPAELADALSTCDAFVAMYSPSYFDRQMCRWEWNSFAEREWTYQQQAGLSKAPGLLLPVLWIHPRSDQRTPTDVQYSHNDFGPVYAAKGLEYLLRLYGEYETDYQRFLISFAERLISVTNNHRLPPPARRPDPRTASSVPPAAGGRAGSAPAATGPRKVWFIVVAGTARELEGTRTALHAYGEEAEDWRPFAPSEPTPLCPAVQVVAGHAGLRSSVSAADGETAELVAGAGERDEIAILLVDAWTIRLEPYLEIAQEYNQRNLPFSAVLIPWNMEDPETVDQDENLQLAIKHAFGQRDTRTFRDRVVSHPGLLDDLKSVIVELQRRAIEQSEVRRQVIGRGVIVRPVVTGP